MSNYLIVGWREHLALPFFGIPLIKAKIDTGAKTSAIHAFDVELFSINSKNMVRFKLHPYQRDTRQTIIASSELIDKRYVRNSGGTEEMRPVIKTFIELGSRTWEVELTLTNRELMGFRMLLGRQALNNHVLIDPSKSFLLGGTGSSDEDV